MVLLKMQNKSATKRELWLAEFAPKARKVEKVKNKGRSNLTKSVIILEWMKKD